MRDKIAKAHWLAGQADFCSYAAGSARSGDRSLSCALLARESARDPTAV